MIRDVVEMRRNPASSSTLSRTLSNLISRFSSSNSSRGNPLPSARMRRISSVSCNRLMTQTRSLLGTSCSARCSMGNQRVRQASPAQCQTRGLPQPERQSGSGGAPGFMNGVAFLNLFHFLHGMLHSSSHRVLTVRVVVRKPSGGRIFFEPRHLTFRELSGVGDEQFQRLVLCQMAVEMFKQLSAPRCSKRFLNGGAEGPGFVQPSSVHHGVRPDGDAFRSSAWSGSSPTETTCQGPVLDHTCVEKGLA